MSNPEGWRYRRKGGTGYGSARCSLTLLIVGSLLVSFYAMTDRSKACYILRHVVTNCGRDLQMGMLILSSTNEHRQEHVFVPHAREDKSLMVLARIAYCPNAIYSGLLAASVKIYDGRIYVWLESAPADLPTDEQIRLAMVEALKNVNPEYAGLLASGKSRRVQFGPSALLLESTAALLWICTGFCVVKWLKSVRCCNSGCSRANIRMETCSRCGYALRGLDGERCPECGSKAE